MKQAFRLFLSILFLSAALSQFSPAFAQDAGMLTLGTPDASSFPEISFTLDASDAQGNFVDTLSPDNLQVIEDGQQITPSAVEKVQNGLQVILAVNTSSTMATPVNGIPGYQKVQNKLLDWARTLPEDTPDDFSLSTSTGLFLIRERSPQQLIKALTDYQPDLLHTPSSLGSLAEALDLATDPLNRPMMKRSILFITPTLSPAIIAPLSDLTARAKGSGVRVNVWMLLQSGTAGNGPNPLQELAESTGGQFVEIPSSTPLPEVEPYFQPLRFTYLVKYTSAIQKGASHTVSVKTDQNQAALTANTVSYDLNVQPPNPIFLSPPASVQRTWRVSPQQGSPAVLTPDSVPLQIMVEFPDQHQRPLQATRLFVNGEKVAENTSPPFDQFNWSIADLDTASQPTLHVEAVDNLGLTGKSADISIDLVIEQPAQAKLTNPFSGRALVVTLLVTLSGAALILILMFSGGQRQLRRAREKVNRRLQKDPVTQPVKIKQDHSRPKKEKPSFNWPEAAWVRQPSTAAPARLVTLDENEEPVTGGAVPLARQEITFGSDPQRATQLLVSPTVDGLHARLYRDEAGNFFLADQNSIAGTWINFAPITSSGARLEHGDLIHIGKVMFRFELNDPALAAKPEVKVIDLDQ